MTDTKVSALTSAATLNSGDYLLLVQAGSSLKVDLTTFLSNQPVHPVVKESAEAVNSGALSTALLVSAISANTAGASYTLAAGSHGMEKIIVVSAADATTPTASISVTSGSGVATISFSTLGASVTLRNVNGLWYCVSQIRATIS